MNSSLVFEKGPHQRTKRSTTWKMNQFGLCLIILYLFAVVYYFLKGAGSFTDGVRTVSNAYYGLRALQNGLFSLLGGFVADIIYCCPQLFKSENKGHRWSAFFRKVVHSYSYITSFLVVLLLPIGIRWWQILIVSFFSTFVCKHLFGGFGSNIVNPAIAGRVLAQIAFSSDMHSYVSYLDSAGGADIYTGASITTSISSGQYEILYERGLFDVFLGNYYGALGETFAFLIIIMALYLIILKVIDWRVPLFYIGSIYLSYVLMFYGHGWGSLSWNTALYCTLVGGVMFGGVFCLTDPVTTPTSKTGRIIFALGCAILTMVFRLFTNYAEGVALSILLMNFLTPLIDKVITGRQRKLWIHAIVILIFFAGVLAVGYGYGATHEAEIPSNALSVTALSGAGRIS